MTARRVVASVVTMVVGLGALGLLGAATLPIAAGSPLLPPDGYVAQAERLDGGRVQVEQAVTSALALPGALGAAISGGTDPASRMLRVTLAPGSPGDSIVLGVDGDELVLHGFGLGRDGLFFEGGVPLVDGTRVTGTAHVAAVSSTPFEAQVRLARSGACEEATIDVDLDGDAERLLLTLCEGQGVTAFRAESGGAASGFVVDGAPVPFAYTSLEVPARDWRGASEWEPVTGVPEATDPFGSASGSFALPGPVGAPAALLSGDLAVADEISDDVLVFRLGADGRADLVWRGHPGGQLVGVVAVGDLVVAVAAGGELTAYSVDGVRVWESEAATESIVGMPAPATGYLSFATIDGVVWLLDGTTGEVVWQRPVAERLDDGVVADDRVIFAFDGEGNLFGFTYDGAQPWYGAVPSAFDVVAFDADRTYLGRAGTLEAYSIWDSTYLWATGLPGAIWEVCSTQVQVAAIAGPGTVLLDPGTGAITRDDPRPADALECGTGAVAVVLGDTLEIWSAGADDLTLQMPVPIVEVDFRGLAPAADGVWVVDEDALVRWGA